MSWERMVSKRFYKSTLIQGKYTSLFSMIGMGVGCFALILSLSVMNGFENIVHGKLKGFEGDIRIIAKFAHLPDLDIDGIDILMPFLERRGVVEAGQNKRVVTIKAIDEDKMADFYKFPLRGAVPESGQIVIGQDLANRLGKEIGDLIILSSPIDQAIGFSLPDRKKLLISGIFSTKVLDYDDRFTFITLDDGFKLFKRKIEYDGIDIRALDEHDLKKIKSNLKNEFHDKIKIQSWDEQNISLVNAMKMERLATIVILSLIFLVAAFNLASSLTLISIQKMKEVGILKAMGASSFSILKIMVNLGLSKAGKGALFGYIGGILVVLIQKQYALIPIPSEIYFIDALPMELYLSDFFLIGFLSIIFICGSSLISGRKIANSNLQEGLRWVK